jgi:polyvinyl alcohol dehydrogenase (cytochrome)
MRLRSIVGAALAVAALASPAVGQAPASAPERGAAIYAERCKECHESGDERAPPRAVLATKPAAEIVAALTTGPMAPVADGLTPEDKQAVAAYLTAH